MSGILAQLGAHHRGRPRWRSWRGPWHGRTNARDRRGRRQETRGLWRVVRVAYWREPTGLRPKAVSRGARRPRVLHGVWIGRQDDDPELLLWLVETTTTYE